MKVQKIPAYLFKIYEIVLKEELNIELKDDEIIMPEDLNHYNIDPKNLTICQ